MTPEELQSLRDWAALKMGWVWSDEHQMWCDGSERDADDRLTFANPDELDWINDDPDELGEQASWLPDQDANQTLMLVEKFEEEGAEIIIRKTQTQVFYHGLWYQHGMEGRLLNTLKALHKAARATED